MTKLIVAFRNLPRVPKMTTKVLQKCTRFRTALTILTNKTDLREAHINRMQFEIFRDVTSCQLVNVSKCHTAYTFSITT
jgi:hypothetical protein